MQKNYFNHILIFINNQILLNYNYSFILKLLLYLSIHLQFNHFNLIINIFQLI
jgi:hypothetical protein